MQKYPMKMSIKGAEGGIGRGWGITPWEVGVGFQSHRIILLRFWYFFIFSFSLSIILVSPGIATSIIIAVFSILVKIAISGLLSAMILWHCKFMSHISFWLTFSLTVWGLCRYHFSDFSRLNFSRSFQWTIEQHCYGFFCILSGLVLSIHSQYD